MILLIFGLILFLGTHAFTIARGPRADLIERFGAGGYKIAYTALSLTGFVLMIYGFSLYRANGMITVWDPPLWTRHLALLLMWPVFICLAATGPGPSRIKSAVKHPMLLAIKIWATTHLLVNGDLGSMLLFGGFLAWAVAARISLKRRTDEPAKKLPGPPPASWRNDAFILAGGTALWFFFARNLHSLLIGVPVWPGSA